MVRGGLPCWLHLRSLNLPRPTMSPGRPGVSFLNLALANNVKAYSGVDESASLPDPSGSLTTLGRMLSQLFLASRPLRSVLAMSLQPLSYLVCLRMLFPFHFLLLSPSLLPSTAAFFLL